MSRIAAKPKPATASAEPAMGGWLGLVEAAPLLRRTTAEGVRMLITVGVCGGAVKLKSKWLGRMRVTRREWIDQFIEECTAAMDARNAPQAPPAKIATESPEAQAARFAEDQRRLTEKLKRRA